MDDLDEHIASPPPNRLFCARPACPVWQAREAELDAHEDIERTRGPHY